MSLPPTLYKTYGVSPTEYKNPPYHGDTEDSFVIRYSFKLLLLLSILKFPSCFLKSPLSRGSREPQTLRNLSAGVPRAPFSEFLPRGLPTSEILFVSAFPPSRESSRLPSDVLGLPASEILTVSAFQAFPSASFAPFLTFSTANLRKNRIRCIIRMRFYDILAGNGRKR